MFPCYSIKYFQILKTTVKIVSHDVDIFIQLKYLCTINPWNMCMDNSKKMGGALILLLYPSNDGSFR